MMRATFATYRRRRVQREAQRWAVRLDGGNLTARERSRLKAWLARDEHAVALQTAQAIWSGLDASRDTSPAVETLRRWGRGRHVFSTRPRLRFMIGGAALATCLAAVTVAPLAMNVMQADASTSTGEQRVIVLDDGSRVVLNSASSIDVRYTATRRGVRLLSGEARFEAAPNRQVPFVVDASGGSVTALGTVFVVRSRPITQGGGAVVTGVEHRVRIEAGGRSAVVGPGQQTSWTLTRAPLPVVASTNVNAVGWAAGVLQFEDAKLSDIVGELNRYTSTRILVMGAARDMPLSGVFFVRNPVAGLVALESSKRLRVTRLPGLVIVRRY